MSGWADDVVAARARGPTALVTVLATEGSAPRGPGARMVVTAEGQSGTIGGGALEWQATDQARAILALPGGSWRVQDYPLGPLLGQCCGGRVRLLVEHLADDDWTAAVARGEAMVATLRDGSVERTPGGCAAPMPARGPLPQIGDRYVEPDDARRRRLILFGAGHVGRAIARLIPGLAIDLAWYDSRAEAAATPGVVLADPDAMAACAAAASGDDAVLILTHDHGLDYRLTAAALGSPARFVGLIGSATKRARFVSRLRGDGIDPARLTCPIGLAGITGKEPATVALATVAQMLTLGRPA